MSKRTGVTEYWKSAPPAPHPFGTVEGEASSGFGVAQGEDCPAMRGRLDRRHNGTPHPVPLPFGRVEGESSSGFGVAHAADYSVYSRAIADLG